MPRCKTALLISTAATFVFISHAPVFRSVFRNVHKNITQAAFGHDIADVPVSEP